MEIKKVYRSLLPISVTLTLATQLPVLMNYVMLVAIFFLLGIKTFPQSIKYFPKLKNKENRTLFFILLLFLLTNLYQVFVNQKTSTLVKISSRILSKIERNIDFNNAELRNSVQYQTLLKKLARIVEGDPSNRKLSNFASWGNIKLPIENKYESSIKFVENDCNYIKDKILTHYSISLGLESETYGKILKIGAFEVFELGLDYMRSIFNVLKAQCNVTIEEEELFKRVFRIEYFKEKLETGDPPVHDERLLYNYTKDNKYSDTSKYPPTLKTLFAGNTIIVYEPNLKEDICKEKLGEALRYSLGYLLLDLQFTNDFFITFVNDSTFSDITTSKPILVHEKDGNMFYDFSTPPSRDIKTCTYYFKNYLPSKVEYLEGIQ